MRSRSISTTAAATAAGLALILAWEAAGLDLPLARLAGDAAGFAMRDHWMLSAVLHTSGRYAAGLLFVLCTLCIALPLGPWRVLPEARRIQLPVSALIAWGIVWLLKASSQASCPWDLVEFGGVARHIPHWTAWFASDGGPGRCFPAGHAGAGFAFVAGYFSWRHERPAVARAWLAGALAAGFGFGLAQQWRGAHFMSHTLWTAWICWVSAWLLDSLFSAPAAQPVLGTSR